MTSTSVKLPKLMTDRVDEPSVTVGITNNPSPNAAKVNRGPAQVLDAGKKTAVKTLLNGMSR